MKKVGLLAVCVAAFGSMCLQASTITVINPGFESDVLAPGGFTVGTFAAGWTCNTLNCGVFRPGAAQYPGGVPEGFNVGFSNSGIISQILTGPGSTLGLNMIYTLNVNVGKRLDNPNSNPLASYLVELLAGTTVIASDNNLLNPAGGTFLLSTVNSDPTVTNALAGQTLSIRLRNNGTGGQVNFDAVSLSSSAVPEPAAISLGLIGFALLGGAKKFRGALARR